MDNIKDYLSEGKSRLIKSDYLTAIEFFQVALEIEPENEEALLGAALAYQKQGNIIKAKKCYFRVLSNDPEQSDALRGIKSLVSNGIQEVIGTAKEETEMDSDKDFRVANWGDSKQMVKKLEGKPDVLNEADCYVFSDKVALLPCTVFYSFIDDKLSRGTYIFKIEHSNRNKYIDDYEELVDLLTSKYGKPTEGGKDNAIWINDLYRDDYSDWGRAISIGHLAFLSTWETHNTVINCMLNGDNYEIKLAILYNSKEFSEAEDKNKKQNKMKGL